MRKIFTIVFLLSFLVSAQTLLNETFTGSFPPAGWTIDAQAANWTAANSANAGGTAPELRFNYSPTFNGVSRFISPSIDLTGQTTDRKSVV